MGTEISNLTNTIDIHYTNVDKVKEMTVKIDDMNRLIVNGFGKNESTDFHFHSKYRKEMLLLVGHGMTKVL